VSGQVQGAREFHKAAKSAVSGKTPALIQARLEAVAVGLVQAGVLAGDVGALQLSRADWLKKAGQFKDMVSALDGAAQHFEKMEKWAEAFDCRIRSAQSLLAAGNRASAMGSARQALDLAERSGLAGQKAHGGRLASPVGPEQTETDSLGDLQVESVDRLYRAE
jgi:tetratricopeptide (TPR) repeat protein